MFAISKQSQFKKVNFRLHKSIAKALQEITHLYQYDGIRKFTQTDHLSMAINLYAETLKRKKIKPGDEIAVKLFK